MSFHNMMTDEGRRLIEEALVKSTADMLGEVEVVSPYGNRRVTAKGEHMESNYERAKVNEFIQGSFRRNRNVMNALRGGF